VAEAPQILPIYPVVSIAANLTFLSASIYKAWVNTDGPANAELELIEVNGNPILVAANMFNIELEAP
jgi:hypothetical protein